MTTASFREKLRTYASAAKHGAERGAHALAAAPWKRIGLWAGGIVAGFVALVMLVLVFIDWNAFKGPIQRMASHASGREIIITGDLNVHPWSFTPEASVQGVRIGNLAPYRTRGDFAQIDRATISVRLLPLLIGRYDIVRLDLSGANVALYRTADGHSNWASQSTAGYQFNLPAIQRFTLQNGRLQLQDDKRRVRLNAAFTSRQGDSADPSRPFELTGEGVINDRPFNLDLTGAALIHVRRERPYGFFANIRAGGTRLEINGAITRPFDLNVFNADVRASGPDLADLYYLIGLTLPNTPPYQLHGQIARTGAKYHMRDLAGRVGDSDLRGDFTVTQNGGRALLTGAFASRSLDFDDLLAVLGGAPSTERGETASPEQRAQSLHLASIGRVLPDARLDIHRVRNMDARVHFAAAHIRSDKAPLRGGSVDITLDHGLLRLDPMTLTLAQGRINGAVSINARADVPVVDLDARLSGGRIESFLASQGNPAMTGSLLARVRLTGRGAAVREAAANANGAVSFVAPHGEIRESFAELTGINVTRGLGLLLTHDQSKIEVRCAVAHFSVANGLMTGDQIVFDTETMLIHGSGTVSLRDESFNLQLKGQPKEPRLIRFAAPITVRGHLRDPHIGVRVGRSGAQAGIATVLSTMVAPLAAVLPFIDAGLADDADCAALMASANVRPVRRQS